MQKRSARNDGSMGTCLCCAALLRNEAWLEQVRGRFAKDAKIIVVCSDGNRRTAQAMELLRREGFQNVVALAGGYNAWAGGSFQNNFHGSNLFCTKVKNDQKSVFF